MDDEELKRYARDVLFWEFSPRSRDLRDSIARLPMNAQLAVAAACCDLLHPGYRRFMDERNEPDVLLPIIDRFWDLLHDPDAMRREIHDLEGRCEAVAGAFPTDDDVPCRVADPSYRIYVDASAAIGAVDLAIQAARGDAASNSTIATNVVEEYARKRLWHGHMLRHPGREPTQEEYDAMDRLVEEDPILLAAYAGISDLVEHVSRDATPTRTSLRAPMDRLATVLRSAAPANLVDRATS